ncbi:hypothetical protein [Maribacter sp. Asnod1-A12]|uniref:hypothetical protein n=1 Tax=Maribacter sp. Asnod1-A12 TaxID=3160576 RepID=UPI00386D8AA7
MKRVNDLGIDCWLLAVGCWLLVVGCWLLENKNQYLEVQDYLFILKINFPFVSIVSSISMTLPNGFCKMFGC